MDEHSLIASLDRMEAALDRIEARAAQVASVAPVQPDTDLEQRHHVLRSSVQTALDRIEALIAEQDA